MTPTQLTLASAERRYRLTKAEKLRDVLRDRQWHTGAELAKACGWRFGAAVLVVARGSDGGCPWLIERQRLTQDGSQWRYRYARQLDPSEVPTEEGWKAKALRLEREMKVLQGRLVMLEAAERRRNGGAP
jgi:hypothetical protein